MKALKYLFVSLICSLVVAAPSLQAADMPGSKDHPKIPRIEGSVIYGYEYADYDEARFYYRKDGKKQWGEAAGKRTRILYLVNKKITMAAVLRNYAVALEELGETSSIYSCGSDCPHIMATGVIWEKNRRIPTKITKAQNMYIVSSGGSTKFTFTRQGYAYSIVTTAEARYHISVYTAEFTPWQNRLPPELAGMRSVHVEIIEEADFKPTLKVVTADEITKGITEKGKIALYGINFDFDSDELKADSTPALESIASAMESNPLLNIFVVGHTDDQGDYEYNLGLSKRRAASVVQALNANHGIAAARLIAAGVGPVSPVASNATEEGQALNRRVELVKH